MSNLKQAIYDACHGVQAGMKFLQQIWHNSPANEKALDTYFQPWALRMNSDLARADHGALAGLLIKKGLFTQEEYMEALLETSNKERVALEKKAKEILGTDTEIKFRRWTRQRACAVSMSSNRRVRR